MSTKLILLLIFVGLACYVLGRRSARRGGGGGEPMLLTSAPRTLVSARTATAAASAHGDALDAASLEEVKRLLGERRLIEAIRIYRERTNCGLREAKEACESIAESL